MLNGFVGQASKHVRKSSSNLIFRLIANSFLPSPITTAGCAVSSCCFKSNPVGTLTSFAAAPAAADPMVEAKGKLQKLKGLLEDGLISQSEFDAKKAEILSKI